MEIAPVIILLLPVVLGAATGLLLQARVPLARLLMIGLAAVAITGLLISPTTGLLVALFALGVAVGRVVGNRGHAADPS